MAMIGFVASVLKLFFLPPCSAGERSSLKWCELFALSRNVSPGRHSSLATVLRRWRSQAHAAKRLDPTQAWRPWPMHDLKNEFVGQKAAGSRGFLAATRHTCFQSLVMAELRHLSIGGGGVGFDPQELVAKDRCTNGCCVEASIAHQTPFGIPMEPCLVPQGWVIWSIEIDAFQFPPPFKPVGVDQVVLRGGPGQGARQLPVRPAVEALFEGRCLGGPARSCTQQDGSTHQQQQQHAHHV